MPPKGRPPKKKRNISGLKNQPSRSNAPLESITESNPPDLDDDSHENGHEPIPPDAKDRASSEHEDNDEEDSDLDSDLESESVRRFINRSWRFMSAYRLGLTGYAAAWAVRKQRQHRQVSQRAMMSIDAVLTTSDTN